MSFCLNSEKNCVMLFETWELTRKVVEAKESTYIIPKILF
jgi:hypothetical protein